MMIYKFILGVVVFTFLSFIGKTQTIEGSWKGNIDAGGNQLPLVFHIKEVNNQIETNFDSPAQNAFGIKRMIALLLLFLQSTGVIKENGMEPIK